MVYVAENVNQTCRVSFIYLSNSFGKEKKYYKRATATLLANYIPAVGYLLKHLSYFAEVAFNN